MKTSHIVSVVCCFLLLCACGRLDPLPRDNAIEGVGELNNFATYVLDQDAGGLFEQEPEWYTYYSLERQILSNLDVYSLRAKGRYYKMQIVEVYPLDALDDETKLGFYRLRLDDGTGMRLLDLDATACGTGRPGQTNPCLNTEKDVYTYLNLATLRTWTMSDEEAKSSLEWDIAFKTEEIKLNSGNSGPGRVAGAILSRDQRYFDQVNGINNILQARANGSDLERFQRSYDMVRQFYYGPDGAERIVYEPFWFEQSVDGLRVARSENWWIIRNRNNEGFSKFSVSSIDETRIDDSTIESVITFLIHTQEPGDANFPLVPSSFSLSLTSDRRGFYCLELNGPPVIVNCRGNEDWDMRFVHDRRTWFIETKNGARGPISQSVIVGITAG